MNLYNKFIKFKVFMILYCICSVFFTPVLGVILLVRFLQGKEVLYRLKERLGIPTLNRPKGFILWIHASSIGEGIAALNLSSKIIAQFTDIHILITTCTNSSARLFDNKNYISKKIIHQFLPIGDNLIFVNRFFRNWRPDLGIFIESELWPYLIFRSKKFCKLFLFSARISDNSFLKWKHCRCLFNNIVSVFDKVIVQSDLDLTKFNILGIKNAIKLDNIKLSNKKLIYDHTKSLELINYFTGYKVIVFASTHLEDEKIILNVIQSLKQYETTKCYFIIIPRHLKTVKNVINLCKKLQLSFSISSTNNFPLLSDDIYIVDEFGLLGLFYSISYITFVGGSFKNGGHNIVEPIKFDTILLFGPDMSNFSDLAKEILSSNAAIQIYNKEDLLYTLLFLLNVNEKALFSYKKNGLKYIKSKEYVVNKYLSYIKQLLII